MTNEIESLKTDESTRRAGGGGASPMLYAFAALALLLAAYAHWRFGQFDERIDRLRRQMTDVRATQERLTTQLGTLGTQLEQSSAQIRTQIREFRDMPVQVGELGQSVAELRARTEAPQRAWVRAEALYLLELGARRLQLEHDVPTAIAALESANARLATVNDPAVGEVRTQLAQELAALRSVNVPNLPQIIQRLAKLEAQTTSFRVLGVPVAKARRSAEPAAPDESAWARARRRFVDAWHDLVSFRSVDPASSRLVTAEEEALRRQHLDLLFFAARIAAMQQDREAYGQSLRASGEWLDRYFDSSDDTVTGARLEIEDLATIDVDPARPEIGSAAQLLQRVIRAGAPAATP